MSSLVVYKPMGWIFKTKHRCKQAIFMADRITFRKHWLSSNFIDQGKGIALCSRSVWSHHVTEEQAWVHRPYCVQHRVFLSTWVHKSWDASKACLSGGQNKDLKTASAELGRYSFPARVSFPNCDHFSCKWMLMWTIGGLTLKLWNVSWMSKLCVLGNVSKSSKCHSHL